MIIDLIFLVTFMFYQLVDTINYSIMYQIIEDSVVCINANTEYHYVSNINYETIVCSYGTNRNPTTLVFLVPPETVSNTVQCTIYSEKYDYCPNPYRLETDRQFITDLDKGLDSVTMDIWLNKQGY